MAKRKARNVVVSSDDDEDEVEVEEETSDDEEEEESESASEGEDEEDEEEEEDDDDEEDSSSEEEENDGESSKRQALRKLLEPFGKDQIVYLLKEAASKDPSILSRILQKAESDPTHRNIFVHGLGWEATEEQLLHVFKPFGEIEEVKLITDKVTGRAKGYAFVLFKTISAAQKALKDPQKRIGNRTTSCQLASLGRPPAGGNNPDAGPADVSSGQRKLFVMNVAPTVNVDRLRSYFGKFGEIENGPMGLDPATNKPRGYAIFTYKSVDGLKRALEEPVKFFDGCQLNCKKFIEGQHNTNVSKNTNSNNSTVNSGLAMNVGENLGSTMTAGGMLMQQNTGIGLVGNPMWAAAALNQAGLGAAMAGIGSNYGINSMNNSSVLRSYATQVALQGLGVAPLGQSSSVGATSGRPGSARNQSAAVGSSGMNLPSYFSKLGDM